MVREFKDLVKSQTTADEVIETLNFYIRNNANLRGIPVIAVIDKTEFSQSDLKSLLELARFGKIQKTTSPKVAEEYSKIITYIESRL